MAKANPEQRLWDAVIFQAIEDAASKKQRLKHDSVLALRWFEEADTSFQFICELAAKDPNAVRNYALAAIADRKRKAGGGSNSQKTWGTGGGSASQDLPEIEFFQKDKQ